MLSVLVTGAAGLIGGEVCARLSARGAAVTAMVRRRPDVRGNDGTLVPLAGLVRGDVTAERMGLDPEAVRPAVVIHCAAALEFDAPEEELRLANVEGVRNAVAFARSCGARFLHVSTAYVCGLAEGRVSEGPVPPGTRFANRYEASKAQGEAVVRESGLPFAIARPSITLGEHESGAIRDFPSLCNVFRLMARGKVSTFPASAASTLDLVPICHVAEGIALIAERMEQADGGTFHLVASDPLPSAELAHGVARVDWFPDPQVVEPDSFDPAALSPAERRVLGRMVQTFGSYFQRDPRFDDRQFRALTGLACPPTDSAWLDRLIGYGIERGYLPPPPSAHADSARQAACARPAPTSCRP